MRIIIDIKPQFLYLCPQNLELTEKEMRWFNGKFSRFYRGEDTL
tara:strand:+ start:72 stop:203 length:132 start_codon:yes stop_codon:yes gene_type:complete